MASRNYKYYQPNKMDLKDEYGDCVIRALTKVTGKAWEDVFDDLVPIARKLQCMPNGKPCYKAYLESNGFVYHGVSNAKGTKRPTVDRFSKDHTIGTYFARVAHHVIAIIDGVYYDTWDSGECSMYGYWEMTATPPAKQEQKRAGGKFDEATINELVKRLEAHYPHSYSTLKTIYKEAKALAEEC